MSQERKRALYNFYNHHDTECAWDERREKVFNLTRNKLRMELNVMHIHGRTLCNKHSKLKYNKSTLEWYLFSSPFYLFWFTKGILRVNVLTNGASLLYCPIHLGKHEYRLYFYFDSVCNGTFNRPAWNYWNKKEKPANATIHLSAIKI